jgi:hypothetical protein
MECQAKDCIRMDALERIYAKPVGSYSLAGMQPKVSAVGIALCDEHDAEVRTNLSKGVPL